MPKSFPFYQQHDAMDCGAACLRMVARHYGRFYSLEFLRQLANQRKEGVSLLEISDAAEHIGMRTLAAKLTLPQLRTDLPLPAIAHWRNNHYVVIYDIGKNYIALADPAAGLRRLSDREFLDGWVSEEEEGESLGIVLALEPTPAFFQKSGKPSQKVGIGYIFQYLAAHRNLLVQLLLGLSVTILLQIIFPFLMQALVDIGVNGQDFNFILLILLAWIILYGSQVLIEYIRNWLLLHIGARANINLMSDFLQKVLQLPIRFFDQRLTSDILKRIYDNARVEHLLTSAALPTVFSTLSLILMGMVLAYFDLTVFLIYLFGTLLYVLWISRFMSARKELDYERFDRSAESQDELIEMISGMQEIKLHNAETLKRWEWERAEARLFHAGMDYLAVNQRQRLGAQFLNELKNILITVFAAQAVLQGKLSIGMLVAIQYIVGQLNAPLNQLIEFFRDWQDARISLERMNEVHQREPEENPEEKIGILPEKAGIHLEDVSFQYGGSGSPMVLKNVTFSIPYGKTTAIVGSSGSGKTTLLKLLLHIYEPTEGVIKVGEANLHALRNKLWRAHCGAVLQEGYIFSDSIARNIALADALMDEKKMIQAARTANILSFIESLPLGFNTRIGASGIGLSQGQKQRILIARAIYKNPDYFFFDEATNSLDSLNEMVVFDNLEEIMQGRTVVIIAHRLQTIQQADQIVVLEEGEVVEMGTHDQLTARKGAYYRLLRQQEED